MKQGWNYADKTKKRIEDYGINIGELPKGKLNKITDVKGKGRTLYSWYPGNKQV